MRVMKSKGRVYGADMTAAEKKAMRIEIQHQFADFEAKHINELDAVILWHLHEEFGFGQKRLKRFYDTFRPHIVALLERYSMEDSDKVWLCTYKLKQYGVDIEKWNEQRKE